VDSTSWWSRAFNRHLSPATTPDSPVVAYLLGLREVTKTCSWPPAIMVLSRCPPVHDDRPEGANLRADGRHLYAFALAGALILSLTLLAVVLGACLDEAAQGRARHSSSALCGPRCVVQLGLLLRVRVSAQRPCSSRARLHAADRATVGREFHAGRRRGTCPAATFPVNLSLDEVTGPLPPRQLAACCPRSPSSRDRPGDSAGRTRATHGSTTSNRFSFFSPLPAQISGRSAPTRPGADHGRLHQVS